MIPLLLGLVGSYVIAEGYKKYFSKNEKHNWENFIKMHHGEAGVIITTLGIIGKSPSLIGSGLGLMIHDKDDQKKWFRGNTI